MFSVHDWVLGSVIVWDAFIILFCTGCMFAITWDNFFRSKWSANCANCYSWIQNRLLLIIAESNNWGMRYQHQISFSPCM